MKTLKTISVLFLISVIFAGLIENDKNHKSANSIDSPLIVTSKTLDANSISTWFFNDGHFNRNPISPQNAGFEWPKGTGQTARYSSGLWIGAKVGNDTLVTVAEYTYEYLPGYTDDSGIPHGRDDSSYRVYKITFGVQNEDRAMWPNVLLGNSDQGAPVYSDGYSWHPLDFGTQTMYYVYTDSYPDSHINPAAGTAPLKADVKQLNFSIDIGGPLGQMAFSQFTIINRSTNIWNNAFLAIWTDDDLGNATDDLVGCDTTLNLGYTYNGTNLDPVYGMAPPAVGFLLLRGAIVYTGNNNDTVYICKNKTKFALVKYKDEKMSVFNWYANGQDPRNYAESYRLISGYHPRPGILGDTGIFIINPLTHQPTHKMFTGDPAAGTGWVQSGPNDQRFIMSTGPVNMMPGDTQVIVTVQVIARGSSNLNSISQLKSSCIIAEAYYNDCYDSYPTGINHNHSVALKFDLYQNYPNPFNPVTQIKYSIPKTELVSIKVYNVLGKEIMTLVNEVKPAGTYNVRFDGSNLSSGVYFYKLTAGNYTETKKMVLIK